MIELSDGLTHTFTQIARRAMDEAGAVKCTLEEYIAGLNVMMEEIVLNLDVAEADLPKEEDNDGDSD